MRIDVILSTTAAAAFIAAGGDQPASWCATPSPDRASPRGQGGGSDCSLDGTTVLPQYAPDGLVYRIPVVFHVIQSTSGEGFLPEQRIHSQIEVLNQDFRAIPGTNGEGGVDSGIEFFLATEDPDGAPASGITYSVNDAWFANNGQWYDDLAWDPQRYLNVYTHSAGGALGYATDYPASGIAGQVNDGIVLNHLVVGLDAPLPPYDLGRTGTHEVGHYLGLYHTFEDGCAGFADCSSAGDLICDTSPQETPTIGCPDGPVSCGGLPVPFENYMDYTDDACKVRFSPEQVNRMRCTIETYRPSLPRGAAPACSAADLVEPFGVLDLSDVQAFTAAFVAQDGPADLAPPSGVYDLADVQAFLDAFNAGCP
jgi:hypothetical protein